MEIFQIIAFMLLILLIAYSHKEALTDAIPVAVCFLVLILYVLALVNGMLFADCLSIAGCVSAIIYWIRASHDKRKDIISFFKREMRKPGTIMAAVLLFLVPVLVSGKVVIWWDDYNFWAADAKSIFYLNGFADKYQNVAPEFGDYPPGTQMMKWWFLHLHPSEFKEGLLFSGYYFMNLAFLVPLLKYVPREKKWLALPMSAAMWIFPTCVEVFGCDGCCADLTMAVIFGAFLVSVTDMDGHDSLFYYGRSALFLMVLVLCKNTGFLWVGFGLLFAYGYHFLLKKKETGTGHSTKMQKKGLLIMTMLPIMIEGSWLTFCLLNRRVAKLTGTALYMATGSMRVPEVQQEMINAFVTAFVSYPLHRWKTIAIDLSPLMLYILLLVFVFLLYRRGRIKKWQAWYIGSFLAVCGIVFYAVNLLSHLTIFAVETQYLEPFGMVSSIERYGAPFTIGGLYLVAYFVLHKNQTTLKRKTAAVLICMGFVFLTADYESAYRGLIGYGDTKEAAYQEREEIIDSRAEEFLTKINTDELKDGGRVLYLRDASDVSWVRNTYLGFEASPVSVMYGNINGQTMTEDDIIKAVEESHAGYLYVDELKEDSGVWKLLTTDGSFEYGCLYRIEEQEGKLVLQKG